MKKITIIAITFLLTMSNYSFGQTYYSENFEGGLNGWVVTDLDADTHNWAVLNASTIDATLGSGSLVSFSYDDTAVAPLTPDNLATSPAIDLTAVTASNVFFLYDQLTASSWPDEHYAIYITTSNDPAVITASTPLYETDVSDLVLTNKALDITSYIGQTIYVSFRHFSCTDKYYLIVDNMSVVTLPANDVSVLSSTINRYSLLNINNTLSLTVKNKGANTVNNLTVKWNDGTDHISIIPITIASQEVVTIDHPTVVNYSTLVDKNIVTTITNIDGNLDSDPTNNSSSNLFNTISQSSPKKVLFEEGTGTWCGWCPRGAVAMNYMTTTYPNDFIGVAVHNGSTDPMKLAAYDTAAGITGFPGMNVDRAVKNESVSQNLMISHLNERRVLSVPVSLVASGTINGTAISINASATFRANFANANYSMGVIISEDNVHGTATGYKQTNYYANNANGPMGGFESLANPVPAAQMYYNHVGRALVGGYNGQSGSVPTTITDGQVVNYTFNYTKPTAYVAANMNAVLVLIDQITGEIVNAVSIPFSSLGNNEVASRFNNIQIYPNPAIDNFSIQNLKEGVYNVAIYDLQGRLVQKNDNKSVDYNQSLNIQLKNVASGEYIVNISLENESYSTHLLVK